jgi:hypothetical protein
MPSGMVGLLSAFARRRGLRHDDRTGWRVWRHWLARELVQRMRCVRMPGTVTVVWRWSDSSLAKKG